MEHERRVFFAVVTLYVSTIIMQTQAIHFRGGTINWKPEGGTKVRFYFRTGWKYGRGPGCTQAKLGQLVTELKKDYWACETGCQSVKNISKIDYYCTGANKKADWEQGENNFTYTFPNVGPFTVAYTNDSWIKLSNNMGDGYYTIATTVDLRTRSDTGTINSSPVTTSKPIYPVQYGCKSRIQIPVLDPDKDTVRCRWAAGKECISVCRALPGATIDEKTCTLSFSSTKHAGYIKNGLYAVALTIEDFPKTSITMGSTKKTPSDVISSIPLQFLVQTISQTGRCDANPRFVPPTPEMKEVVTVDDGDKVMVDLFADNANDTSAKANRISVQGPITMTQSPVIQDVNRTDTFQTTVTWQTNHRDVGDHIVCASVENSKGKSGDQRCFSIKVTPKGCKSLPCQNNGMCIAHKCGYKCVCRPGYTGPNCGANIDDCTPNPCVNGTQCIDGNNSYVCSPISTTISSLTPTTNTNSMTSCQLAYEKCSCKFSPNHRSEGQIERSIGDRYIFDFLFGFPFGLVISVFTFPALNYCKKRVSGSKRRHPLRIKPWDKIPNS